MKTDQFKEPKRLIDVDSVAVSLFFKGLFWALPPLCIIGFLYGKQFGGKGGAFIGIALGAFAGVVTSLSAMFISDKIGGIAAFIYKGPKANWSIREQVEGDLNQVRYHKMNKRFDQALLKVEEVLVKVPAYADALYLKASILWEGFDEPVEAKRHLGKILKTTSKTDPYHIWASALYKTIVDEEKRRLNENSRDERPLV